MKVKVHYFASLRETIGRGEDTVISVDSSMTTAKVWTLATGQASLPDNLLTAVNQEYTDLEKEVVDGDEIAFFPPVTGG